MPAVIRREVQRRKPRGVVPPPETGPLRHEVLGGGEPSGPSRPHERGQAVLVLGVHLLPICQRLLQDANLATSNTVG